ncbi:MULTISPECIES: hypothetical protein [Desulfovibrio]|jgi:hypothetical protein|uniref:hypothetical protein n=1 Tax=Desulfovibrio TaxID=872 RepID=UPI002BB44AAD|nr:hypothetical protein [Desulfovibrio sp.]HMM39382.1 hypothetical protein [Desulfovibrio sp.]
MSDDRDKNLELWLEALAKGILVGGSLGLLAGWTGIMSLERGLLLGALVGCLAGISFKNLRERKK